MQEVQALIPGWGTKIPQAMRHGEMYIYILDTKTCSIYSPTSSLMCTSPGT